MTSRLSGAAANADGKWGRADRDAKVQIASLIAKGKDQAGAAVFLPPAPYTLPVPVTSTAEGDAFARLFESVHEGVYIGALSASSSSTLSANPYLKLIFGYPAETPTESVCPFAAERFLDPVAREAFLERLQRDRSVTDYLLRLRRADRTPIWVEVTARADVSAGGLRVEALMRDVTERKRLEDQARDLYQQLLQAEKLAALGQTISGVAHELNNPLATILTWAERLCQRDLDEPTRRGLDTILSESERAAKIVRNLLLFARKRHSTRTMVDLNQVVRETLALRSYDQGVGNVTIIEALAAGLPRVFADPHQVQQVLLNLVINAEQAMISANGRGTLVLHTWHHLEREAVVLDVSDDGPGVPPEVQPRIFDPFFTTKEVGKGTGLGLTVAYAIVQEHGGRITLKSDAGGGATFSVELPADASDMKPVLPPPKEPAPGPVSGVAVLVVEDEAALGAAVAESLQDTGYLVDRASDGLEALERLRQKPYDLIICDLKMPRLDGTQLYRELELSKPEMLRRIMFVTGDVAGTDAERFLEQTGCRWLAKPFRLKDLLRAARDMVT